MEALSATEACFDDGFLDFALEGELMDDDVSRDDSYSSFESKTTTLSHEMNASSFSELIVEEELEWLSNKDAFPSVESCFGILSDNPQLVSGRKSPISVLENTASSYNSTNKPDINASNSNTLNYSVANCFAGLKVPINFPVRSRSNRRRKARKSTEQSLVWTRMSQGSVAVKKRREMTSSSSRNKPRPMATGRRCLHCQVDKTPQWRAGPLGPKTLCNACGVRYKSGRLLPEYRPANSPTFSSALHSNSHRKVVEMRKHKEVVVGGGGGDGEGLAVN